MWDTVDDTTDTTDGCLSHDLPCQQCGHAMHTYLACDDLRCGCPSSAMPGAVDARVA